VTLFDADERGFVVACPACSQKNRLKYAALTDQSRCGACKQPLPGVSTPLEVTSTAAFDRLIATSPVPVVVDYWAPWCGPCRMVAPELAKVAARSQGRFIVIKVNTDALNDLGDRFKIRSIPTMAIFAGGREKTRSSGARPAADIEAFVHAALSA
jgi:thioredoxin 2